MSYLKFDNTLVCRKCGQIVPDTKLACDCELAFNPNPRSSKSLYEPPKPDADGSLLESVPPIELGRVE